MKTMENGILRDMTEEEEAEYTASITLSFADKKAAKLTALGNKRYAVEQGGIVRNGMFIATDDRSKLLVFAARTKATEDNTATKKWKVSPGVHVTLDAPTLIFIGDEVEAFISDCFDREASLAQPIVDAANETALDAVNINSGWPS